MHLNQSIYHRLVLAWIMPILVLDLWANAAARGSHAEYFYVKSAVDLLIAAYAAWKVWGSVSPLVREASADVAGTLDSLQHVYCAALVVYAVVNWWTLHRVNVHATGLVSFAAFVWSLVTVAVGMLSAWQFYHLKAGLVRRLRAAVSE